MRPMLAALPSDSICSALAATCFLYLPHHTSAARLPFDAPPPAISAWHPACLGDGMDCTALPVRAGQLSTTQKAPCTGAGPKCLQRTCISLRRGPTTVMCCRTSAQHISRL